MAPNHQSRGSVSSTTSTASTISSTLQSLYKFSTYLIPTSILPLRVSISSAKSIPTPEQYPSRPSSRLHCARCGSDLAFATQIISKGFTGRHGRAYLVSLLPLPSSHLSDLHKQNTYPTDISIISEERTLPNTRLGGPVPRQLVTGMHTVRDVSCSKCRWILGWKYVHAEDPSQAYKVGKFILETRRIGTDKGWGEERELEHRVIEREAANTVSPQEIEFDSEDEDDCEDLFNGVWDPVVSAARRKRREEEEKKHGKVF